MNKILISMSFDPQIAKELGVDSAIIFQNIVFWIAKNKANEKHFYDGKYWTYNSNRAFLELFTWLSEQNLRTCLKKLIDKKYLVKGNFNKIAYDRTTWYSIGEKYQMDMLELTPSLCEKQQIDLLELTNENVKTNEPIPYINTDIKQHISLGEKKKSKKTKDKSIEDLNANEREVLDLYNSLFRNKRPSIDTSWVDNFNEWLEKYDVDVIKEAIVNWHKYPHWSKDGNSKNGLPWLFRTRDRAGNPVNYIDQLLALGDTPAKKYRTKEDEEFARLWDNAL